MTMGIHPQTGRTATPASVELEQAHQRAVRAAVAGLSDSGLAGLRLAGPGVGKLAEAAVTSATPYLRSPLLSKISGALRLHPPGGESGNSCPTCATAVPCATARELTW